jgi:hypothetical protein
MKARRSLRSAVAFGLVLACASAVSTSAHADEPDAAELTPPETLPTHVLVHVESAKPVQLESRALGQKAWTVACGVPCDRELALADEYRFAGGPTFRLNPSSGSSVLLKVHPASAAGNVGGAALVGVGAVLAVIGAAGVLIGVAAAAQPAPSCGDSSSTWCGAGPGLGKALALISLFPLVAGGGMVAGGASLLSDSKTSATQRPWSGREPTWVGPQSSAPKKAGLFVPLSFSF